MLLHKTQSISLSSITISLDSEIFSPGQAYVALSRCTSWENFQIISFDKNANYNRSINDPKIQSYKIKNIISFTIIDKNYFKKNKC